MRKIVKPEPELPDYAQLFREDYLTGRVGGLYAELFGAHAKKKGPRFNQMRAFNTLGFAGIGAALQGQKAIYRKGAISKGMRAHYQAKMNGPFRILKQDGSIKTGYDVFDLDEKIGSQNFVADVIQPNTRAQIEGLSWLRSLYPDKPIVVPILLQGAAFLAGQPNFDRGVKRKDKDYMVLWGATVYEFFDLMPMQGDWPFSAMTNVELSLGQEVAAGDVIRRTKADMDFRDVNGRYVTLYEQALKRFEYLCWAAENRFDLYIEPLLQAYDFTYAMRAERGTLPPHANKDFVAGIENNLPDLRYLQNESERLMLGQVASGAFEIDTRRLKKINPVFAKAVDEAKSGQKIVQIYQIPKKLGTTPIRTFSDEALRTGDYDRAERAGLAERAFSVGHKDINPPPMRSIDLEGRALDANDGKNIFSRELLQLLTEREVMQIKFLLGVLETAMLPATRHLYVVADDKYGPATQKHKDAEKLAYADELPGKLGKEFAHVRSVQRQLILHAQNSLRAHGHVLSTVDFGALYKAMQDMPELLVAPGEAMPNSPARLLLRQSYLARNATDLVFKKDMWEESNDGVQDMVFATRLQLGLDRACENDPRAIRIYDEVGKPLSLLDRMQAIWPALQKAVDAGREPGDLVEPATALAQLWAFHRLLTDQPLRKLVFNCLREEGVFVPAAMQWHNTPIQAGSYDSAQAERLWHEQIYPVMEQCLAPAVRLRHLTAIDDFAEIQRRQEAANRISAAGDLPEATRLIKRGGVAGVPGALFQPSLN